MTGGGYPGDGCPGTPGGRCPDTVAVGLPPPPPPEPQSWVKAPDSLSLGTFRFARRERGLLCVTSF